MIVTEYMENGSLDTFLRVRNLYFHSLHVPWGWFLLLSLEATETPVLERAVGAGLSPVQQTQGPGIDNVTLQRCPRH